LRGTNGEDDTISWPFSAKKFRKVDLISLTPLMFIQSGVLGPADLPSKPLSLGCYLRAKALLDKASFAVQKLCNVISGLPQARNPVAISLKGARPALTGLAALWSLPISIVRPRRERPALVPAPKEQPPRKLSGKRTAWL
jgi:hypothetical protein